jgi:hypothetical protein
VRQDVFNVCFGVCISVCDSSERQKVIVSHV